MAATSTNQMSSMLQEYARRMGLQRIDIGTDMQTGNRTMTIVTLDGMARRLTLNNDATPQNIINTLRELQDVVAPNIIDLTQNAIESLDDVVALLTRAKEAGRVTNTILLTREQADQLLNDEIFASQIKGGEGEMKSIYGHTIEVQS